MNRLITLSVVAIIGLSSCVGQVGRSETNANGSGPTVTMETLLGEMVSRDAVTEYPKVAYTLRQTSSADRRTVAKDEAGWFANDDGAGYERLDTIDGRVEKVMFDQKGPGAVVRIWMTTKEKYGTMRIYLDGEHEASIVIPAYDMRRFPLEIPEGLSLTHTHYTDAMDGVGGNSFFLPIPYRSSCKITFEEPDLTVKIPRYYHINYRTYAAGTNVKTFTLREAKSLRSTLNMVSNKLLNPTDYTEGESATAQCVIESGESQRLRLPEGENAVRKLAVRINGFDTSEVGEVMRNTILKITFDGKTTVNVPLSDFAGAGMGAPRTDGWYLASDGKGFVLSRWVMPYREAAAIEIINQNAMPLSVVTEAVVDHRAWSDSSLYFHCNYRYELGIQVNNDYNSDDNLDWNFQTITGRGIYCGDLLSLYNHAVDWYGEGDEKIYIDGEDFPSTLGTGTEDYYNCSWAPVVPFLTPYGGAPRADKESSHGYNAFLRTRNLDVMPFEESFQFDIEMLSWHKGTVDYYTTCFWYGDQSSKALSSIK